MRTKAICLLFTVLFTAVYASADDEGPEALQKLVAQNPHDFGAVSKLAEIYLDQENYDSAAEIVKNYLDSDSMNVQAIYLYGRVMDLSDNILEAISYYLLAIERDSTFWRPYKDLALLYDVFADHENTNKFIMKALMLTPYPESLYYEAGYSFDMLDESDSAMVYYKLAIRFDSTDSQALMNIGALWGNRDEADSARYYTKKSLDGNSNSPGANFNFGEILTMDGDTAEAISYFSKALALDPDLFAANKRLGELFEAQGDSSMARLYFEEFLKDAPMIYAEDIKEVENKLSQYK